MGVEKNALTKPDMHPAINTSLMLGESILFDTSRSAEP
jgi:hypothetical protein